MSKGMGDSWNVRNVLKRYPVSRRRPFVGVEIGVWRGCTSAILLEAFPHLHLYMIDPWEQHSPHSEYFKSGDGAAKKSGWEHRANLRAAIAATEPYADRRTIVQMTSVEAARQWVKLCPENQGIDFAFIDGNHTYDAVRHDVFAWGARMTVGGLLCGHDYGHPRDQRGIWGVSRAVNEFAALVQRDVCVLPGGTVWWLEMTDESIRVSRRHLLEAWGKHPTNPQSVEHPDGATNDRGDG